MPSAAYFTPNGRGLVIQHDVGAGSSWMSLTYIELATGAAVARATVADFAPGVALTADGARVLVPTGQFGFHVFELPSLAPQGVAALSLPWNSNQRVLTDLGGRRALVFSGSWLGRVAVVDLVNLQEERVFSVDASCWALESLGLAADDTTLVVPSNNAVVTYDLRTGGELARRSTSAPGTVVALAVSGDRTVCVVAVAQPSNPGAPLAIERFGLPGLTPLGSVIAAGVPPPPPGDAEPAQLDRSGARLLLAGGAQTWSIDTATGAAIALPGAYRAVALSPTGDHALVGAADATSIVDARTGSVLASTPALGFEFGAARAAAAPDSRRFAALSRGERVQVYDILAPNPSHPRDLSTGFGEELGGPVHATLSPAGDAAWVTARDSNDLWIVDLDGPPVLRGRIPLDRQPHGIAVLADGRAVVAHGRGASLSVVDVEARVEVARHPLPGHAIAVFPEPTGARVWVELEDATRRGLVQIDSVSGLWLRSVSLPGGTARSTVQPVFGDVRAVFAFDFARGRALVATPDTAELHLVDLTSGTIAASVSTGGVSVRASLALRSDGALVVWNAGTGAVRAFDVGATSLSPRWARVCYVNPAFTAGPPQVHFVDGERSVFAEGIGPVCDGWRLFDAATGATQDLDWGAGPTFDWVRAEDREVWRQRGASYQALRVQNGSVEVVAHEPLDPQSWNLPSTTPPQVHPVRRTAFILSAPAERSPLLLRLDTVRDAEFCAPATPNQIGRSATLRVDGTGFAGGLLHFTAEGLEPHGMLGYLVVGSPTAPPSSVTVGIGSLCIASDGARFTSQAQVADAAGRQRSRVDTSALPPGPVLPGSSWLFQVVYRDRAPGGAPTLNTSTARRVYFH